jgi:hypothetical protein
VVTIFVMMLSAFHFVASARARRVASLPFSAGASFAGLVRHCAAGRSGLREKGDR